MLNLDKINTQFDVNNLDVGQISNILVEHKRNVILVFLMAALIVAAAMFFDYRTKEQALHTKISQEQRKIEVIKDLNTSNQDFNTFKSSVPKAITGLQLITMISNDANLYQITVDSLSPSDSKDMGLYDEIDITFDALADNFKDMMLFLRSIEKSDPPLRIDSWSGTENENGKVSCQITISAVHIHP